MQLWRAERPERITKVMMIALLASLLCALAHSLPPGAAEGMKFYLLPSAESIRINGLGNIITAMNQAFFTSGPHRRHGDLLEAT